MTDTAIQSEPLIRHPLLDGCAPEWASGWGQDKYGIFAEFSLPARGDQWITQRMRWIPPGTFHMGSPDDQPGRYNDEGPQHEVTITKCFWMFDTPCTQALWQAVMREGENPSGFVDAERPVEQVSWEEAQVFIEKLNAIVSGLALRMPTEAEWEYACRAGSTDATYAGPIEIHGDNNAPILDAIAWYGGNSGVDFDLDNGVDSSEWPEKQYGHTTAGTRTVAQKRPNRWGLYDMLGNVWEWCQDWYGAYSADRQTNPQGPGEGRYRVLRGGAWSNDALEVRSACRNDDEPGGRSGSMGFRCAQVQESEQEARSGT